MDILAHGLWTGAATHGINKKIKKPINVWWTTFWGVFPDLFAFTIPFIWVFIQLIGNGFNVSQLPRPQDVEPVGSNIISFGHGNAPETVPIFQLTSLLYSISHSAVVFFILFGIVYLIYKRPVWELSGWLLHILIDIPTHSYKFYPTPVFWPLSGWKFNGWPWGNVEFQAINYGAIAVVYLIIFIAKRRSKSGA